MDTLPNKIDPTPSAPGRMTPSGIVKNACRAMLVTESSGMTPLRATAAASDATAPAEREAGGVLIATPARGSNAGANSMAVATKGKTLSLEASKMPRASNSSAFLRSGAAVERVNPAFSSLLRSPNLAVYANK